MKQGTDAQSGKTLGGLAYLRQRFNDVINTPLGALVGARDFGSRLHELVDRNIDPGFEMQCYIRLAEAVASPANGLDDFILREMRAKPSGDGNVLIDLRGDWRFGDAPIHLEGLTLYARH
ncbi:hypothetical protein [Veronia pacifica]|uniref:Baseplate assembly protein n=1 Tax=Veronia pacifica TaxID=1080227 RepID=A0A1C3EBK5_9GAMM|nr:hypothetical protein [Veronia pacifica]ODA30622.1 hypothetical protein A8L45_19650 [Veronia pacifica]